MFTKALCCSMVVFIGVAMFGMWLQRMRGRK
ncbi:hypothetical protein BXY51_007645 [Actinoplanes cyaneus]|nr:hypothetical protein [Actinoplanes cyaneus]